MLGEGKYFFDSDKFPKALITLERILTDYKNTDAVLEAIYLRGVSQHKNTGNPLSLKRAYEILSKDFPNGEWAKRAYPYRLIG